MQKSGLVSFIIILISLVVGFVFVWPEFTKVEILRTEKSSQEVKRDNLKRIIANIDELSGKYEQAKNDLEKLSLAIPSDSQVPEILIQIEEIVKSNGLVLGNISFAVAPQKEESQTTGIKIINFRMNAEGDYSNFKNLLIDIEENIRLMDVTSLTFGDIDPESGFAKFEISLNAYYLEK